jgi:prevent-host-death family protein
MMGGHEPAVRTIGPAEAREQFDALVEEVARGNRRVLVERDGTPVVAVVPADDFKRLAELDADERRFAILDEIGEAFADIPEEELEREVAKAVAEVREERRQREREANAVERTWSSPFWTRTPSPPDSSAPARARPLQLCSSAGDGPTGFGWSCRPISSPNWSWFCESRIFGHD